MSTSSPDTMNRVPHYPELEKAIIGQLLFDPERCLPGVRALLTPECFYNAVYQKTYKAILALDDARKPVDQVSLMDELRARGDLESVGQHNITGPLGEIATVVNAEYHAKLVLGAAVKRKLQNRAAQLVERAGDETEDVNDLLSTADRISDGLDLAQGEFVVWSDATNAVAEDIQWAADHPGEMRGLSTGLPRLDELIGGLEGGYYYLIGARPSEGKTAVALSFAMAVAKRASWDAPVLFFSREMPAKALATRGIAQTADVNLQLLRSGGLPKSTQKNVISAIETSAGYPILCDEHSASACEIRAAAQMGKRKHNIGLVIVDYLQRVEPPRGQRFGSRDEAMTQISRTMKNIAMELNVPVLVPAQLNREVEKRADKRPQLGDLRESGSIEQDADVAMFLYRPGLQAYRTAKTRDKRAEAENDKRLEIIVRKQRNGPIGTVLARFDPRTQVVSEWKSD